jgi:hypothetical protein
MSFNEINVSENKKDNEPRIIGYWTTIGVHHNIENIMPWDTKSASYTFPIADSAKDCQKHIIAAISKLETSSSVVQSFGYSDCRICQCNNGTEEYTHGKYTWPSGYIHYLEKHNVLVDHEFAKYAIDNI